MRSPSRHVFTRRLSPTFCDRCAHGCRSDGFGRASGLSAWHPSVLCLSCTACKGNGRWEPTGRTGTARRLNYPQHLPTPFRGVLVEQNTCAGELTTGVEHTNQENASDFKSVFLRAVLARYAEGPRAREYGRRPAVICDNLRLTTPPQKWQNASVATSPYDANFTPTSPLTPTMSWVA